MHQIQVDTIIVYIKTNTIPLILNSLNPLHFLLCFGRGSTVYLCFFSAGKIVLLILLLLIMVLLLLQNFTGNISYKELFL